METDREYYSRRARQEREAAAKAACPEAQAAHLAIAESYSLQSGDARTESLLAAA